MLLFRMAMIKTKLPFAPSSGTWIECWLETWKRMNCGSFHVVPGLAQKTNKVLEALREVNFNN